MEWIEVDGVFRGRGVRGLGLAGALLGFAEHPEKPVKHLRFTDVVPAPDKPAPTSVATEPAAGPA
jgi:hypothetical protein